MQEERVLHEAKLAKMEAEMKMVFQQKVQEKEAKLKQSEEELYARHKDMKEALDKQRGDLEDKKRRIESGRPLTPEKASVRRCLLCIRTHSNVLDRLAERKVVSLEDVLNRRGHSWTAFYLHFSLIISLLSKTVLYHSHSFSTDIPC